MDASPEARWLEGRSEAVRYVIAVVIPASFGGWGEMRLYYSTCPSKPRGWRTLLVVEYSVDSVGGSERGSWCK